MNITDEMGEIMGGNFITGILDLYTRPTLFGDFFYLILFFTMAIISYMATQSTIIPLLMGLIFVGVGIVYLPAISETIILTIIGTCILTILWKMFIGRN